MRVMITNEGNILVVTRDDDWIELEYEEKMWRELENYFNKNEEWAPHTTIEAQF